MVVEPFGQYIAGREEALSRRELNRLIERYEWFTTARRARALLTGEPDGALVLPLGFWATVPPVAVDHVLVPPAEAPAEDIMPPAPQSPSPLAEDLIDRFIERGGYRIAPSAEVPDVAEVDVDVDPEMVSEELAEIYRAQGLVAEAEKIDRILKR